MGTVPMETGSAVYLLQLYHRFVDLVKDKYIIISKG